VVELGRLAGWSPLPLSVRDARRAAGPRRDRLATLTADSAAGARSPRHLASGELALSVGEVVVRHGSVPALRGVTVAVDRGEIVALMGRNGAGKSTLLSTLVGLHVPTSGAVGVGGATPSQLRGRELVSRVGLVPQEPTDLLVADRVGDECVASDRDCAAVPGTTRAILDRLAPGITDATHPRDLSEGQRLALALAVVLAASPPVLLLDEPTRGLDYAAKQRLASTLRELASDGHCVVMATHDVELAAEVATRVVVLADGEVVADGPATDVVIGSPMFAPQVSKVLAPQPWLTVSDVAAALVAAS
jgi:energy-coupling factor transport system ATP-binding protein